MVELGGLLAAAILKVVIQQIGSAIGGRIKLQKNFTKDLEKMKMALESVEALLEDAGRRSITDERTRLWLKRLKDAMYAISDMIDEFEADTQISTYPSNHKDVIVPLPDPMGGHRCREEFAGNPKDSKDDDEKLQTSVKQTSKKAGRQSKMPKP